jgi:hypothetical protein
MSFVLSYLGNVDENISSFTSYAQMPTETSDLQETGDNSTTTATADTNIVITG